MKTLRLFLLTFIFPVYVHSQPISFFGSSPPAPIGYIINNEGFENSGATGYQSPLFNTDGGTLPNSKFTPAMEGSQELQYTNGQFARWQWQSITNEAWVWFTISNQTASVNSEVGELGDSGDNVQGSININGSSQIVVKNGSSTSSGTTGTMSANTQYWVEFHFKTDGTAYGEFETTPTMFHFGNNFTSTSGGGGTAPIRWTFKASSSQATNYVDHLRVSYTDPGLVLP